MSASTDQGTDTGGDADRTGPGDPRALEPDLERWRLILGAPVDRSLPLDATCTTGRQDAALDWLYGRDEELGRRGIRRRGGRG
ncbi:hypothetical protein KDL01_39750, partial [Actinospica durhamensis]|nr:hypothetical protein [Actinospica durhamensis]